MAKQDEFFDSLVKMAGLIGGAYLTVELLKMFAKKKIVYSCPRCNFDIEYGADQCPNCKTYLSWNSNQTASR